MSEELPKLKAAEAINIALALMPGCRADLIVKAIELAGYKIVPVGSDGSAASAAESGEGGSAESAPPRPPAPRIAAAQPWPRHCKRCNKVINNPAHADECQVSGCAM